MSLTPAEPIAYPTYDTMLFDGTITGAADLIYALDAGLAQKMLIRAEVIGTQEGDSPQAWKVSIQPGVNGIPYGPPLNIDGGAWVVVASSGINRIRVLNQAEYNAEFKPKAQ
ncbi:hypothetical protein HWB51_gp024 [Mycobacterium phage Cuke]|uniref:Uncharacterized protein n=1 Tax=Mycobacterium phage Cuke TaxID=2079417 RepID=A0A2L1IWW1_9CAUD|nr:hypothetical protein HWB51_gp024 [Mycobacterium phage Cuke]AVD99642.1 hypothetical protein SEA_CUKE_24 [Mycobacterium phage Cuke]